MRVCDHYHPNVIIYQYRVSSPGNIVTNDYKFVSRSVGRNLRIRLSFLRFFGWHESNYPYRCSSGKLEVVFPLSSSNAFSLRKHLRRISVFIHVRIDVSRHFFRLLAARFV